MYSIRGDGREPSQVAPKRQRSSSYHGGREAEDGCLARSRLDTMYYANEEQAARARPPEAPKNGFSRSSMKLRARNLAKRAAKCTLHTDRQADGQAGTALRYKN